METTISGDIGFRALGLLCEVVNEGMSYEPLVLSIVKVLQI